MSTNASPTSRRLDLEGLDAPEKDAPSSDGSARKKKIIFAVVLLVAAAAIAAWNLTSEGPAPGTPTGAVELGGDSNAPQATKSAVPAPQTAPTPATPTPRSTTETGTTPTRKGTRVVPTDSGRGPH